MALGWEKPNKRKKEIRGENGFGARSDIAKNFFGDLFFCSGMCEVTPTL